MQLYRTEVRYETYDIIKSFIDLAIYRQNSESSIPKSAVVPHLSLGRRAGHTDTIMNPDLYKYTDYPLILTHNSAESCRLVKTYHSVFNKLNLSKNDRAICVSSADYFEENFEMVCRGLRECRPIIFDSVPESQAKRIITKIEFERLQPHFVLRVGDL